MNERIFGLALQAMDFHGAVDTDTELKLTNDELKKFAELIVRECIEINKQELSFNAFERLMNKYKEYFGVEE